MKQNVFQRTRKKFNNWFFGVEELAHTKRYRNYDDDEDACVVGDSDSEVIGVAPGFTIYQLYGRDHAWAIDLLEHCNKIKIGETMEAVLSADMRPLMFLMAVWNEIHEYCDGWTIAVSRVETNDDSWYTGTVLMAPYMAEQFKKWYAKYTDRFGVMSKQAVLPELTNGTVLNGMVSKLPITMKQKSGFIQPAQKHFKQICWVVEHLSDKVTILPDAFVFENHTEAVQYNLSSISQ